ncbi:hypothetical protein ACU8KH_05917 [Lachancea thermotolerans]
MFSSTNVALITAEESTSILLQKYALGSCEIKGKVYVTLYEVLN